MILVRTKLAPSKVHGVGLFAADFIPKGTHVWKFVKGFDQEFPTDFPKTLSASSKEQFLNYAYISKVTGNYILCTDDMRFVNHSDSPNVINTSMDGEQEGIDISTRDINIGEELLYDYDAFAEGKAGF